MALGLRAKPISSFCSSLQFESQAAKSIGVFRGPVLAGALHVKLSLRLSMPTVMCPKPCLTHGSLCQCESQASRATGGVRSRVLAVALHVNVHLRRSEALFDPLAMFQRLFFSRRSVSGLNDWDLCEDMCLFMQRI